MTAADAGFLRAIVDELAAIGPISERPYFGGVALLFDGRQFAFVMGRTLYLATNDANRIKMRSRGCQPFEYATRSGVRTVEAYYDIPADILGQPNLLVEWASTAISAQALSSRPLLRK